MINIIEQYFENSVKFVNMNDIAIAREGTSFSWDQRLPLVLADQLHIVQLQNVPEKDTVVGGKTTPDKHKPKEFQVLDSPAFW